MRLLWFNLATDADDPVLGFAVSWIASVARRVEEIDVVTMRAGRVEVPGNVRVHSVGKERGYSEPRRALEFYRILASLTSTRRHDACFAHMMPLFAVLAAPVLLPRRIPITLWYAHRAVTPILRVAAQVATHIVTASPESFRLPTRKVIVTGHGIDTAAFAPARTEQRPRPFTLIVIGRLSPIKRIDLVIDAVEQLVKVHRIQDLRVRVIGPILPWDVRYAARLREHVSARGLDACVGFERACRYEQMPGVYQAADVLVSLSDTGSVDKAPLEAMSCGVPVITSNEAFRGFLPSDLFMPTPDSPELARRIVALAAQPMEARLELSRSVRRLVVEAHGLDRLSERLVTEVL